MTYLTMNRPIVLRVAELILCNFFLLSALCGKDFFQKIILQRKARCVKYVTYFIHRSAVPIDQQTNMKAAEDFLLLLLHAHTVAAAKELLSYQLTEAEPPSLSFVAKSIINTHLLLPESSTENEEELIDGFTLYARELLTLSLLWHFFS